MHAMMEDPKTVSQNLREVAEPAKIYRFLVIKEAREAGNHDVLPQGGSNCRAISAI